MLGIYSKSGSKNGKHSVISESLNISSISYLALQTFQYDFVNHFRVVSDGTAMFQTLQFARIPSAEFLCLADYKMTAAFPTSFSIHIDDHDLQRFHTLTKGDVMFFFFLCVLILVLRITFPTCFLVSRR